jgi:hypothetical protein
MRDHPPANGSGVRVQAIEPAGAERGAPPHSNGSQKEAS